MRSLTILAVAAATALPGLAQAQGQNDVAYCRSLASTYTYYVGRSEASTYRDMHRGSVDAQVAAAQCHSRTADSIRVLETRLRDGGFDLPPRT